MLIVALVLAVIGLAALVTAVVTSNELIAWVCIGASVLGVLLLIVDALRERSRRADGETTADADEPQPEFDEEYPDEVPADRIEADDADTTAVEPQTDDTAVEPRDDTAVEPRTDDTAVEPRTDEVAGEERNGR